jgi:hypothetical protein
VAGELGNGEPESQQIEAVLADLLECTGSIEGGGLMSAETNRGIGRKFFEEQDRLRGGPNPDLCAPNYIARLGGNPPMTFADHQLGMMRQLGIIP